MALPTKVEISLAVETPGAIKATELEGYVPISGILGPESYSGGFSIVFPFVKGQEKKAVRIWHQEIDNIKERYKLLSQDTKQSSIKSIIGIEYVECGIRVGSVDVDMTLMEWVEGLPLKAYISTIISSSQPDSIKKKEIRSLVGELETVFQKMHSRSFSHGDLQHDNIIITPDGKPRFVDYDCFYTPSMGNSFYQTTSGYNGYQHPSRFTRRYKSNEKADYFSELVIVLSLLAVSDDFSLWSITEDQDYSLLFTPRDFTSIRSSNIFKRIIKLGDKKCSKLLEVLEGYLEKESIDELQPYEVFLKLPEKDSSKPKPEDEAKQQREIAAWKTACEKNTYEAYRFYLFEYPLGPRAEDARRRAAECKKLETEAKKQAAIIAEDTAWSAARKINTYKAYSSFLSKYPNSKYKDEASARLLACQESEEWYAALASGTIYALKDYIKKHPNSVYVSQAEARIADIRTQLKDRQEKLDWDKVNVVNTVQSYQNYLNKYPGGRFALAARNKIVELKKKEEEANKEAAIKAAAEDAWQRVKLDSTIQALNDFIIKYPTSSHLAEAKAILASIKAREEETTCWNKIIALKTMQAYCYYLKCYPNGRYAQQANTAISELRKADNQSFLRALFFVISFIVIIYIIVGIVTSSPSSYNPHPSSGQVQPFGQSKESGATFHISDSELMRLETQIEKRIKAMEVAKKVGDVRDYNLYRSTGENLGKLKKYGSKKYGALKSRYDAL